MGEIAIFLGRFLQAVDDAMEFADGAVAVRRGKFRHPLAAHTAPQPNDYATVGPLRRRRSDPTRRIVPVRTPTPADPTPADLFLAFGLMQEFAGPRPKRLAPPGPVLGEDRPPGKGSPVQTSARFAAGIPAGRDRSQTGTRRTAFSAGGAGLECRRVGRETA